METDCTARSDNQDIFRQLLYIAGLSNVIDCSHVSAGRAVKLIEGPMVCSCICTAPPPDSEGMNKQAECIIWTRARSLCNAQLTTTPWETI